MKKIFICITAIIQLFLLTSCQEVAPEEVPPEEKPSTVIAFANKSINSYFYIIVNAALEMETKNRGWNYEAVVSDYDHVKQNNQLINLISGKPSAIITNPINSDTLSFGIEKANEQGIPVCVVDTPAIGGKVMLTVTFDNMLAGKMAAEEIVKRLKEKYGKPMGVVYNAYNDLSSHAWNLRKQGFESVLSQYPEVTYIAEPGKGDPDIIYKNLSNTLSTTKIDAVHCSSDHQSRGLVQALKDNNLWKPIGDEDHIIFVTIDGDPGSIEGLKEKFYDATIVQDAISYGKITIEMLDKYIFKGQDIPTGEIKNENSYWETYTVISNAQGYQAVIPPYVMDINNCSDPKHWGNIALNDWGFKHK